MRKDAEMVECVFLDLHWAAKKEARILENFGVFSATAEVIPFRGEQVQCLGASMSCTAVEILLELQPQLSLQLEAAAVVGTVAVFQHRFLMVRRGIAFVVLPAIHGIFLVQALHQLVAVTFGQN